jgi:uncharacterized membrane protein YgaE (UPF0421/DUF939 family)
MIKLEAIRAAAQIVLACVLSYVCGAYFTGFFHTASAQTGGLWAVMSGIVALQEARRQTWSLAWRQILGTLVAAIVSAAYLSSLPFSVMGMAAAIFVTVLVCYAARMAAHAGPAALAVAVVMVVSSLYPTLHPVFNAVLRFGEACIGVAMAATALLLWPEPKRPSAPAL